MATGFDPRVAHAQMLRVRGSGAQRPTAISGTLGREPLRR